MLAGITSEVHFARFSELQALRCAYIEWSVNVTLSCCTRTVLSVLLAHCAACIAHCVDWTLCQLCWLDTIQTVLIGHCTNIVDWTLCYLCWLDIGNWTHCTQFWLNTVNLDTVQTVLIGHCAICGDWHCSNGICWLHSVLTELVALFADCWSGHCLNCTLWWHFW